MKMGFKCYIKKAHANDIQAEALKTLSTLLIYPDTSICPWELQFTVYTTLRSLKVYLNRATRTTKVANNKPVFNTARGVSDTVTELEFASLFLTFTEAD